MIVSLVRVAGSSNRGNPIKQVMYARSASFITILQGLFCLSPLASTPSDTRPLVFQSNTNSRRSPGCQDDSIRCFPRAQTKPTFAGFYSNVLTESPDSRALSTCVVHGQFEGITPSARSCRCNTPLP
ncbi:hypothetical protein AB4K20DRAFT_1964552 [Rhizopus microsporus]